MWLGTIEKTANLHTGTTPYNGYVVPIMYYKNEMHSFSVFRHFTYDLVVFK